MTVIGIEPILPKEVGFEPTASTYSAKRKKRGITGIEPVFMASQTITLPLSYITFNVALR
jgi:hypothetical protein